MGCVSVVFRADGLSPASRVDYWREIISNVFLLLDLRGEIGPTTPAESGVVVDVLSSLPPLTPNRVASGVVASSMRPGFR